MRRAHEIIPGKLWQASHPTKWPDREKKLAWIKENVGLVVVLARLDDPDLYGHEEFEYWHYPVVDSHKTVDPRIPDVVVPEVVRYINAGEGVLVCCLAGRSRSGAASTLVTRQLTGLSGSDALDLVRRGRPNAVKREGPESWLRALPPLGTDGAQHIGITPATETGVPA